MKKIIFLFKKTFFVYSIVNIVKYIEICEKFDIQVESLQSCLKIFILGISPSNAEATSFQSTITQRFLKNILTLSCWYSLDSSH